MKELIGSQPRHFRFRIKRVEVLTAVLGPTGEKIYVRKARNGGNHEIRDVV